MYIHNAHIYLHMGHHTFTCARLHMCTPSHVHTFTCAHLHMCTPSHVHTFTCAHLHICTPSHAHLHMCTPSHVHTFTCAHLHMCTPSHVHTFTYAHLHTSFSHIALNVTKLAIRKFPSGLLNFVAVADEASLANITINTVDSRQYGCFLKGSGEEAIPLCYSTGDI